MSSLFCFVDFMWRYHGSKGVPERLVEDGVLGNLAPPGDLEESASHHYNHMLESRELSNEYNMIMST